MKKETWLTSFILIGLWTVIAFVIDNEFLLPGPFDVLNAMCLQLLRPDFIVILCSTSLRTLYGCLLSLVLGAVFGIVCGNSLTLKKLFEPIYQIIKTIPNITYILIVLIWLGQENSVHVIIFCILFPMFYGQFTNRSETILKQTSDLLQIYPVSVKEKWFHILFPMLLPEVFTSLKTGIGLGFKVCVMAEILGQVSLGIGRAMNYDRLNLELASVFGWTIWLILISLVFQKLVDFVQKITN